MPKNPIIIDANISFDDRGEITYCNSFNFLKNKIKRFYLIKNNNINFIRAWHGHKKEEKYLLVLHGRRHNRIKAPVPNGSGNPNNTLIH